jgi:hypothetical protein
LAKDEVKDGTGGGGDRKRFSDAGMRTLLALGGAASAAMLLVYPQPAEPLEMPSLRLDPAAVEAAREADVRTAKAAPRGEDVIRLERLILAQGEAELGGESRGDASRRSNEMFSAMRAIHAAHGGRGLDAIRSALTLRAMAALDGEGNDTDRRGLLGAFGESLRLYGVIRGEDVVVAPPIVVRALYKGRLNELLHHERTAGLRPVELQAYWGWLAFHAERAEIGRRLDALRRYEEAGGRPVPEAWGVLLFRGGAYEEAGEYLRDAYAETGNLRIRNHSLAALAARPTE